MHSLELYSTKRNYSSEVIATKATIIEEADFIEHVMAIKSMIVAIKKL